MTLTIRSAEDLATIHNLIERYLDEVHTLSSMADNAEAEGNEESIYGEVKFDGDKTTYGVTRDELIGVYERRRDALANQLLNKGIAVNVQLALPAGPLPVAYPYNHRDTEFPVES